MYHARSAAAYMTADDDGGSARAGGMASDDARGRLVGHGLHEHFRAQGQPGEVGQGAHGRLHLCSIQARRRRLHAGCRRGHRRHWRILQAAQSQGALWWTAHGRNCASGATDAQHAALATGSRQVRSPCIYLARQRHNGGVQDHRCTVATSGIVQTVSCQGGQASFLRESLKRGGLQAYRLEMVRGRSLHGPCGRSEGPAAAAHDAARARILALPAPCSKGLHTGASTVRPDEDWHTQLR